MKKISMLFFCFFFTIAGHNENDECIDFLEEIKERAEQIIWHDNTFTGKELQFLLNFSCAAYGLIFAENALLQETQFIFPMSWHVRFNNKKPTISKEHINIMQRSLNRTQELLDARSTVKKALKKLFKQLDENENEKIQCIIDLMTQDGALLFSYISSNHTSFKHDHDSDNDSWTIERKQPSRSPTQSCDSTSLAHFEIAQSYTKFLAKKIKHSIQAVETIADTIKNAQEFGSLVYYIYFKVLYDGMKQRKYDDKYFEMMFEKSSIIAPNPATKTLEEPITNTIVPFFEHLPPDN